MKTFERGNRDGGDRGFNKGSFRNGGGKGGFKGGFKGGWKGGDRDSRPMTMHPAVCSSCQKACEVPFRPTGEKPVYCRDCFAGRAAMGGERSSRRDERSDTRPQNSSASFSPKSNFNNSSSTSNNDELKRQIDSMNVKLDKLTNTIQNMAEKINKNFKDESEVIDPVEVLKNAVKRTDAPVIFSKSAVKPKAKKVSKKK